RPPGEPRLLVHQLLAGGSLRAQPAAGDGTVGVTLDLGDPAALGVDELATAHRAVRAHGCRDRLGGLRARTQPPGVFGDRRRAEAQPVPPGELAEQRQAGEHEAASLPPAGRGKLPASGEAEDAETPGDEAVDAERQEAAGLEELEEELRRDVGGHKGTGGADQGLRPDAVAEGPEQV